MENEKKMLVKFYFEAWKRKTKLKKEKAESVKIKLEQREKLDNLVKAIKKYKKEKQERVKTAPVKPSNNYKNRFEAQKSTIEKLTAKLEEKDRLIEELKSGIFDKEAMKSLNQTKIEIREIFAKCSPTVRSKIPPPPEYNEKFMISTQKAPKIVHEMEGRALERAKKRETILERKRIIEEKRQKMIAEALEKKRIQDEEEKKRNLEKIKERRRKEMELEKLRQAHKVIFLQKQKKAVEMRNRMLLEKGFRGIRMNHTQNKNNYARSVLHHKIKLLRKFINLWKQMLEKKYRGKNALADAVFAKNILSRVLKGWWEVKLERMRSTQVAEDFYDLLLMNNTFVHWHRYVCVQIMLREKQMQLAQKHYNRCILFHYFYQWCSLPAVNQLEKSKEMKKKKWREKVWEILPDYKPPTDEDYV